MSVIGLDSVMDNLRKVGINTVRKAVEKSEMTAAQLEGYSHSRAPWTDRTGNARASIYGHTEVTPETIKIIHGIGVNYGKYLELSHGGKYRVIGPATLRYRKIWEDNLKDILTK